MQKVLITGAKGFIGSHLVDFLKTQDFEVFGLRRNSTPVNKIDFVNEPKWITKDFTELTKEDLKSFDILIHLAAIGISPRDKSWEECMSINFHKSLNLIELAIEVGIKKILISGTAAEYGETARERQFLNSNDILKPYGSYATSKSLLSLALRNLVIPKNVQIVYLRLFSVYGEGQNQANLWPQIKYYAENGLDFETTFGEQIRDFIHVNDVCVKMHEIIKKNWKQNLTYLNIGSGIGQSVKDFSEKWWKFFKATGSIKFGNIPYRDNELMNILSDPNEIWDEK